MIVQSYHYWIDIFNRLGQRMDLLLDDPSAGSVVSRAAAENPWFSVSDIRFAAKAIQSDMLDAETLSVWLQNYDLRRHKAADVALILAGNIPMVGFHDLMAVLVSGNIPYVKTSSKDSVLIDWVIRQLEDLDPGITIRRFSREIAFDAAIVSGSDNTERYFKSYFASLPSIIRGSRNSAAVLTGDESEQQLCGLAEDIFRYSGLGCRNVSLLLVPRDYDIDAFARTINRFASDINPKFINNYRRLKASLSVQNIPFTDCGSFVVTENDDFRMDISNIAVFRYLNDNDICDWIARHDHQLQCLVGGRNLHSRSVDFGCAQKPRPWDYPDGIDTLEFLLRLN